MIVSVVRRMWGIWVDENTVYSPIDGVTSTTTPRGSIAFGMSRAR